MFGDADEITARKPAWQRIGVPAVMVIFASGAAYGIVNYLKHSGPPLRPHVEQRITAINLPPPPPPPPPPKIEEKPKEIEKVEQKVQPKAAPKVAAPTALTALAGVGNDPFGLKAGEPSDGSCVSDCGAGDADQGPYYQSVVRSLVADALRADDRLRAAHYNGTVTFVFDQEGRVQNVTFQNFDGDADTREAVIRALARVAASEAIPADMQNGKPWVVRINAHAPG
jgi:protein TonB